MRAHTCAVAIVVSLVSPSVAGQADLAFEVASVRPNSADDTAMINVWTLRTDG